MPSFIAVVDFQFNGQVFRPGKPLEVPEELLMQELAKGVHSKTGKYVSGLLNHSIPADEKTSKILANYSGPKPEVKVVKQTGPTKEDEQKKEARLKEIRKEFAELGLAFDNRWGLQRLESELHRLKLETGKL